MSLISRDGNKKPSITPEMAKTVEALGFFFVQIICDTSMEKLGDGDGLSFMTMATCVPGE
jgi:hypothetical protein